MKFLLALIFCFFLGNISAKDNSVWIKSNYFRGYDPTTFKKLNIKEIVALANRLKVNNIKYAYIFAGPYGKDGHLPSYAFSDVAKKNILLLKKIYPQLKILPWIGGIQNKTVYLENASWVRNAISDTFKLSKLMPIDGIHLDLEYVKHSHAKFNKNKLNEDEYGLHWLAFHQKLRMSMPETFLSTVVASMAKDTKPWKHKHTLIEIQKVSLVINQISFMFYETSLMDIKSYTDNLKEQVQMISDLKKHGANRPQYLFAIGIFKQENSLKAYRDLGYKNIPFILKLLEDVQNEINNQASVIDGLAIYCDWMVTQHEWNQLRNYLK